MNGQQAAPAYRIHQGETVLGVVWSNAVVNMDAWVRVTYDDGTSDTLRMDRFVTGSARTAQLISTVQVARHDGYVTEGLVFSDAPQRGQTYVVLYIAQGYNPGDVRMALCKGYVYASTPLVVGQQVEPGPAGGHGNIRNIALGNPAANVEFTSQAVPTGAIWRHRSFQATLAQGITQTPLPTITYDDGTNKYAGTGAGDAQVASTTVQYYASINIPYNETGGGALVGLLSVFPLPDLLLPAGHDINWVTLGMGANSDWGAGFIVVEEWVMPN